MMMMMMIIIIIIIIIITFRQIGERRAVSAMARWSSVDT